MVSKPDLLKALFLIAGVVVLAVQVPLPRMVPSLSVAVATPQFSLSVRL